MATETLDVIECEISRLKEVEGIGEKRIRQIKESWQKQKEIKNVMLFLQDHGVSTAYAAKIYRQYGNESIEKVKENPFRLADDIWGIGFRTADGIAQKLGFEKEAFVRLRSGILYTLSSLADEGHVYARKKQLIDRATELLEAEESSVIMTLDQMMGRSGSVRTEDCGRRTGDLSAGILLCGDGNSWKTEAVIGGSGGGSFVEILNGCQGEDRQSGAFHRCQKD